MIDLTCERLAPGLLGEPVNTLSNLGFAVVAWIWWRRVPKDTWLRILVGLIAAIFVGSTLFHMTAERWAQVLDVTPIFLFQVLWIWLYLQRVVGLERPAIHGVLIGFLLLALFGSQNRHILNGALPYAPALVVLAACGVYHRLSGRAAPNSLLIALACFVGALVFRIIDLDVCGIIPFGTHFMWHLLNAVVLFQAVVALTANAANGVPDGD